MKLIFNRGLGAIPVSLHVFLKEDENYGYEGLYNEISLYESPDVLIEGDIGGKLATLQWLVPRLRSDGMFVSIVSNGIYDVNPNSYIIKLAVVNSTTSALVTRLTKNDTILFNGSDVGYLIRLRSMLIKHNIECKLMFDSNQLKAQELLNKRIFDIHPY